jgi:hypothetical protein
MICPDCSGSGRIRKRFLLFFTRRARCRTCLGTGEFPARVARPASPYVPLRDDRDTWPARRSDVIPQQQGGGDVDRFDVGSGGRSGGGGGGASWADPSENSPVIVDPFAASSLSGGGGAADTSDSYSGSDSSSASGASSSDEAGSTSSAEGGTSY